MEAVQNKFVCDAFAENYRISVEIVFSEKEKQKILRLEVENINNLRVWMRDIPESGVKEFKHLVENVEGLYTIVKEAISKGPNDSGNLSSNIAHNGNDLHLNIIFSVGSLKSMFPIILEHKDLSKEIILERRIEKLTTELNSLKAELKHNDNNQEVRLPANTHRFKFSANMKSISIEISNDGAVATKKTGGSAWRYVLGDTPFPSVGRHKFSIRIISSASANFQFMIGVSLNPQNIEANGCYSLPSGWMFYTSNGYKYIAGSPSMYGPPTKKVGVKITVEMDMDKGVLLFKCNGYSMGPASLLDLNENTKKELYPAIDLYEVGNSVEIVYQ